MKYDKQIDLDPSEYRKSTRSSWPETVGYLIAAALIIPLGFWLKANYAKDVGHFILSMFY